MAGAMWAGRDRWYDRTMSDLERLNVDVVVVGAGLAGLSAGLRLARAGRSVRVVEAEAGPGGRARTDWHEGRPVDRGFQVAFSAYPEFRQFVRDVGIPSDDLRPFAGGGVFFDESGWAQLSPSPRSLLGFGSLSSAERLRFAKLAAEVRFASAAGLLARDESAPTTEAFLRERGFSDAAIDGLFRPLFGVIFLDRTLGADPGYFLFLLSMLVRGPAVLPTDGLGMVADWAAGAIRHAGGHFEYGSRVENLIRGEIGPAEGVHLADGRRIDARAVVLAVDAPSARRLLSPVDPETAGAIPTLGTSVTSARFALSHSLYRGRVILLNADPGDDDEVRVDLLCQTSNVNRQSSSEGPHIVLATSVGDSDVTADGIEDAVERQVHRWDPTFPWARVATSLGVVRHPFAQFRPLAGVRRTLPGPRTRVPNVLLAGELTTHPSLEGAVASGFTAAELVDRQLG
jgi:phytoene dehydrogenase-like protein